MEPDTAAGGSEPLITCAPPTPVPLPPPVLPRPVVPPVADQPAAGTGIPGTVDQSNAPGGITSPAPGAAPR
jgi:hypothetical protein